MTQAISGELDRISRQTSMPLPSGSRTSRMATWGWVGGIRSRASAAVAASPTTTKSLGRLEQRPEPGPDDLVIVEEKDPYVHARSPQKGSVSSSTHRRHTGSAVTGPVPWLPRILPGSTR